MSSVEIANHIDKEINGLLDEPFSSEPSLITNSEPSRYSTPFSPELQSDLPFLKKKVETIEEAVDPQTIETARRIEVAIKYRVCTFLATGSKFAEQIWYICYTCSSVGKEVGCCQTCKDVCHAEHRTYRGPKSGSRFYCDCGAGSLAYVCQALQPKHAHELQPSDFDLAAELAVALAPTVIPLQLETGSLVIERHHLPRLVSVCVPWQPKGAELSRDDALALMPAQPVIEKWLADWTADMFPDRTFNTGRAIELSDARYRIAVTGHRSFDHRPAESFLEREFEYALTLAIREKGVQNVVGLSGMAQGTDLLFAETCQRLGVAVWAVLAHRDLATEFSNDTDRVRFERILNSCESVIWLPWASFFALSFGNVRDVLLRHADLLLAAWNGLPALGPGGTGDVVTCALEDDDKSIVHYHTQRCSVHILTLSDPTDRIVKMLAHRARAYETCKMLPVYLANAPVAL